MNKEDLKGMRYYIGFCALMFCLYIYTMETGWRVFSGNSAQHSNDRYSRSGTYHHK
jgi:hypothetical protein